MFFNRKRILFTSAVLMLSCLTLIAGGKKEKTEDMGNKEAGITAEEQALKTFPEGAAAVVNGETVMEADLIKEIENYKQAMSSQGQPVQEDEMVIKTQALDSLIVRTILLQEAKTQNIVATDDFVDTQISQLTQQYGGEEQFNSMLEQQGLTIDFVKEQVSTSYIINTLIEEKTQSDVTVKEDEIAQFYSENPQYFEQPEQIQASHILIIVKEEATDADKVAAKTKIKDIQKRVTNGLDFAEAAKTYSDGPSGPKGGDLGFFGKGQMVPTFEAAAYALAINEVSDIVETQFGYHLIKLVGRKEAGTVSIDEVHDEISSFLKQSKGDKAVEAYIESLKTSAEIIYPEA